MAPVLKTGRAQALVGSNPTPSATEKVVEVFRRPDLSQEMAPAAFIPPGVVAQIAKKSIDVKTPSDSIARDCILSFYADSSRARSQKSRQSIG